MGYQAILEDGQLHAPAFEILIGNLSARLVDEKYRGSRGICPWCEAIAKTVDAADGSALAVAVYTSDNRVHYRSGSYDRGSDLLTRSPTFCHPSGCGSRMSGCSDLRLAFHREVVEAIAHQYRQEMPEYQVEVESQFHAPGAPPELYRPDISILTLAGERHTCIEYQRSAESYASFLHRHELRSDEWGKVVWFFCRSIYGRESTRQARDWLAAHGQEFYCCWADVETGILQVEPGTHGGEHTPRVVAKNPTLSPCSTADFINRLEAQAEAHIEAPERHVFIQAGVPGLGLARDEQQAVYREEEERRAKAAEEERLRQAQLEQERRRKEHQDAWDHLQRLLIHLKPLGDRVICAATFNWSTDQLKVEWDRLLPLIDEADKVREQARLEQERRRAQEKAEAEALAARQLSLYQQVLDLIRQLEEDYGIRRVITTVKPTTPLERLLEEVQGLQERLERAELNRKAEAAAEGHRVRREAREQVKVDIERRRQELLAQNAQTPERRQELATLRELLAEALVCDDSKLAIVALRNFDWVNDYEKKAWWDALPSGLQLWIREIHKAPYILPLYFTGEIA